MQIDVVFDYTCEAKELMVYFCSPHMWPMVVDLNFLSAMIPTGYFELLPSTTKLRRLCFYRGVSAHGGGAIPACLATGLWGVPGPGVALLPGEGGAWSRGVCSGGGGGLLPGGWSRGGWYPSMHCGRPPHWNAFLLSRWSFPWDNDPKLLHKTGGGEVSKGCGGIGVGWAGLGSWEVIGGLGGGGYIRGLKEWWSRGVMVMV